MNNYKSYHNSPPTPIKEGPLVPGVVCALPNIKLSEKTCKFYDYQVGEYNKKLVEIANYKTSTGKTAGQKLRFDPKDFIYIGNNTDWRFFGQSCFEPSPEFRVVITEGERDCLAVYEAFDGNMAAVSLPFGVQNAKNAIAKNLNWLIRWGSIVLAFDNDDAGIQGLEEVLTINGLPFDKIKIARWTEKDAHEMLKQGKINEIKRSIWDAATYTPKWLKKSSEITLEEINSKIPILANFPYPKLNEMVRGIKPGRLYMLASGSGMGKTSLAKELIYNLITTTDMAVGHMFLEENWKESIQSYIAMDHNIVDYKFTENPDLLTDEQKQASLEKLFNKDKVVFDDHFGSIDSKILLDKLRYMIAAASCNLIVLDHISIVVSGSTSPAGERKDIDELMTNLRSLIQETGVPIIVISHLKRHADSSYNSGSTIELSDLRGSGSLEQLSDFVIGLEGNQFDDKNADVRRLKVLKCRKGGFIGYADYIWYDRQTGRMKVIKE